MQVLENKNQKILIFGLKRKSLPNPDELRNIIDQADKIRTTSNNVTNETSSRSNAICFENIC